jgi:hypothetical protein
MLKTVSKFSGEILLFLSIIIALFTFNQYGVSWDELQQRETGLVNYDYIFTNSNALEFWGDRDYGVAFELPLILVEKVFGFKTNREIYFSRHLITHLLFLISAYYCFLLIDFLYKKKTLSILGFLMLLLQPVIYGHSFFNSKDLPFLSVFIITLYYSAKAFDNKTIKNFIFLGLSVGLLINIRLMGIMVPTTILFFLSLDAILEKKIKNHAILFLTFAISAIIILYISWPFLWKDPIGHFLEALKNMSQFRFNREMLFNGELVKPTQIQWDYIPTWTTITTPISYLTLGLIGALTLIFHFGKNPISHIQNSISRNNLFYLAYFVAPVLAVIILHSVLYDGWRQMFFIYPPLVLLTIYLLNFLHSKKKQLFYTASIILILNMGYIFYFMVQSFPLQHLYFNTLITSKSPEYARRNYEVDYWGLSYKSALEYILEHDTSSQILVCPSNFPGYFNETILTESQDKRIRMVGLEHADYFISEYRFHPQEYDSLNIYKFYGIQVSNSTVNQIFKLK